jgi:hypothetical protein
MSRLEEALDRLERAMVRFEAALAAARRSEVLAAREHAEGASESRRLREVAGEIGARVDQALAAVDRALQGER